jgi:hypothetical protein
MDQEQKSYILKCLGWTFVEDGAGSALGYVAITLWTVAQ